MAIEGQTVTSFATQTGEKTASLAVTTVAAGDRIVSGALGNRKRVAGVMAVLLVPALGYIVKDFALDGSDALCSAVNGGIADRAVPDGICRQLERWSPDNIGEFDDITDVRVNAGANTAPVKVNAPPAKMPVVSVAPNAAQPTVPEVVPATGVKDINANGMYPFAILRACDLLPALGFDTDPATGQYSEAGRAQLNVLWDKVEAVNPPEVLADDAFNNGRIVGDLTLHCPAQ